ncbi:hypothetical protein [Nonomuraea sp. NPDC050691]|uniref:hypothetical protein n=1 Tax=Nonomuraea sp. NPDC050691 TaxID=3155661 RepID=UPI0033D5EDAA
MKHSRLLLIAGFLVAAVISTGSTAQAAASGYTCGGAKQVDQARLPGLYWKLCIRWQNYGSGHVGKSSHIRIMNQSANTYDVQTLATRISWIPYTGPDSEDMVVPIMHRYIPGQSDEAEVYYAWDPSPDTGDNAFSKISAVQLRATGAPIMETYSVRGDWSPEDHH